MFLNYKNSIHNLIDCLINNFLCFYKEIYTLFHYINFLIITQHNLQAYKVLYLINCHKMFYYLDEGSVSDCTFKIINDH